MAYGNPNGFNAQLPAAYQNGSYSYSYPSMPQQSYGQQPMQPTYPQGTPMIKGLMEWVDGEVGAKAWPMPANCPPNRPVALWDTNDCVIYLKSINEFGMPNPIQKVHYMMDEVQQPALMAGQSSTNAVPEYATKDDFKHLKEDLMAMMSSQRTDNRPMQNKNGVNKE